MRKISASYIISNVGDPIKNGILILNDDNSVAELIDTKGVIKEIQDLEYYSGVLVPGFVDVFTFLSWPDFKADQLGLINATDLAQQFSLGHSVEISSVQRGINHLEAFGTKAAADFFPSEMSLDIKAKSKVRFRNIHKANYDDYISSVMPLSILGRLFESNISKNNTYCIGTGSLSTHQKLSVFDELKYIQNIVPNLALDLLVQWACLNGAKVLRFDDLGSFEPGKKPGLNLITNIDYANFCLKPDSKLKVLI